jgi:phage regulator Rha-like protein
MNAKDSPLIVPRIFVLRGESVMIDSDLAALFGVTTGNFNKAIQRNAQRFPSDFAFSLTAKEFADLMFQIGISSSHGGRRKLPSVFTEHGAIMAATVLNSERAVAMSVYVVRAFVKMRQELLANATLEARLQKIEKTLLSHDSALRDVIQKLRPLLLPPPESPQKRIGFHREEEKS